MLDHEHIATVVCIHNRHKRNRSPPLKEDLGADSAIEILARLQIV